MFRRQALHRFLSLLVLVSLLSSTLAPVARAQEGGATFPSLILNGA